MTCWKIEIDILTLYTINEEICPKFVRDLFEICSMDANQFPLSSQTTLLLRLVVRTQSTTISLVRNVYTWRCSIKAQTWTNIHSHRLDNFCDNNLSRHRPKLVNQISHSFVLSPSSSSLPLPPLSHHQKYTHKRNILSTPKYTHITRFLAHAVAQARRFCRALNFSQTWTLAPQGSVNLKSDRPACPHTFSVRKHSQACRNTCLTQSFSLAYEPVTLSRWNHIKKAS